MFTLKVKQNKLNSQKKNKKKNIQVQQKQAT